MIAEADELFDLDALNGILEPVCTVTLTPEHSGKSATIRELNHG